MKIKLLSEGAKMPMRADEGAAGFDLFTPRNVVVKPGRSVIQLDIAMALDKGTEGNIRPRSGFSAKGIEGHEILPDGTFSEKPKRFDADVLEGTVDESYRGTVGVIINSHEPEPFGISIGTKIAQMVIERYVVPEMCVVDELDDTERGIGGFGHTGAK